MEAAMEGRMKFGYDAKELAAALERVGKNSGVSADDVRQYSGTILKPMVACSTPNTDPTAKVSALDWRPAKP